MANGCETCNTLLGLPASQPSAKTGGVGFSRESPCGAPCVAQSRMSAICSPVERRSPAKRPYAGSAFLGGM